VQYPSTSLAGASQVWDIPTLARGRFSRKDKGKSGQTICLLFDINNLPSKSILPREVASSLLLGNIKIAHKE
jgi:hypothetical protein